jgi:hypothetical protein
MYELLLFEKVAQEVSKAQRKLLVMDLCFSLFFVCFMIIFMVVQVLGWIMVL